MAREPAPPSSREQLPTPSLVVDLDVFERNVRNLADMASRAPGHSIRPHVKAHRTPALARRQLGVHTTGVTCATVSEAEAMVAAGIDDVFVANEIVSPDKLDRLARLTELARIGIAVDSRRGVVLLSQAVRRRGAMVRTLIDIDLGMHRCGLSRVADVVELADLIDRSPGLELGGLMGYEGRVRLSGADRVAKLEAAYTMLAQAKRLLEREGHEVATVSASGTSTLPEALADPTVTEIQAGTYAVMEPDLDGLGLPFAPSVEIVATVISRHRGEIVLDAGRKSIACDLGLPVPLADVQATTRATHEEHTIVAWPGRLPALGATVSLRPLHTRLTFNLHEFAWLVRGDRVVERVAVAAGRGSS